MDRSSASRFARFQSACLVGGDTVRLFLPLVSQPWDVDRWMLVLKVAFRTGAPVLRRAM